MAQYIDKDALVAEIYRLRDFANDRWDIEEVNGVDKFLDKLIPFIHSLEVKEMDVEKEKPKKPKENENYIDLGLPSGTLWKLFNEDDYYTYDEAVEKFGDLLPTKEQWEELKDECKWVWKDNGYDVIGPNGNLIFLPAVGYRNGTEVYNVGTYGYYCSSTYYKGYHTWLMSFDDEDYDMDILGRINGLSVRLVKLN